MSYWSTLIRPIQTELSQQPSLNIPYVRDIILLDLSAGTLEFDGYWYAMQDDRVQLPIQVMFSATRYKDHEGPIPDGVVIELQQLERHYLKIEINQHEFFEDTSVYSTEPGEECGICFFPTNRQKIWFSILERPQPPPASSTLRSIFIPGVSS
jgi:hypothetical protein